jgi:hypothetical protein
MSSFIKLTQHPDTMHWHHALWIDDHFGNHHYGVRFNDGKIFDPEKYDLKTVSDESELTDEIIDSTRDQRAEMYGGAEKPVEPNDAPDTPVVERDWSHDDLMIQLLRLAIDHNSSIMALASMFAGNVTNKRSSKQFLAEYNRLGKDYEKRSAEIIRKIEAKL